MRLKWKKDSSAGGGAEAAGTRTSRQMPIIEARVPSRPELGIRHYTETIVLGREAGCALSFEDRRVSRHHAEVYRSGDVWWIRDLGSKWGTFVDGDAIDAEPVAGRTVVRLGERGPAIVLEPEWPDRPPDTS